jgi:hypothetical protein
VSCGHSEHTYDKCFIFFAILGATDDLDLIKDDHSVASYIVQGVGLHVEF